MLLVYVYVYVCVSAMSIFKILVLKLLNVSNHIFFFHLSYLRYIGFLTDFKYIYRNKQKKITFLYSVHIYLIFI